MNTANVYENLYTNMKNGLTVVNNGLEYSLGEYMLMKAEKKTATKTKLPAQRSVSVDKPISTFIKYVSDKLAVKNLPVKDKTIRTFPLRTSMSALLSAVVACTLIFSFSFAVINNVVTSPDTAVVEAVESENTENDTYDFVEK